jgi:NADH:ubiquinone oxidoreductase subunit 3 (subunit A)
MDKWLVSPPMAFVVIICASFLLSRLVSKLSFRPKGHSKDEGEAYACGQENYDHMAQPDYSTFFPFAFFFTIAHVATLMMTTVHVQTVQTFAFIFLYITVAMIGLYILIRS